MKKTENRVITIDYLSSDTKAHTPYSTGLLPRLLEARKKSLVLTEPGDELTDALRDRRAGPKTEVALCLRPVGNCLRDIPRLHRHKPLLRLLSEGVLNMRDEGSERHGLGPSQVVYLVSARGLAFENGDNARDDVRYVREATTHLATVVDIDRLTREDTLGEFEEREVGPAPNTVDREESQADELDAIEAMVGMGKELVGALGGTVDGHRLVNAVVFMHRRLRVLAIDRA